MLQYNLQVELIIQSIWKQLKINELKQIINIYIQMMCIQIVRIFLDWDIRHILT